MSEGELRPLDRGAGPLLRGWRRGEREGEEGKWAAIGSHRLPLAAKLAALSTSSPSALDLSAAISALPVAPNPLAALLDSHEVLATWPSGDAPIGVPFGAPVQRTPPRRPQSTSRAEPASPLSAQLRTSEPGTETTAKQAGATQRAVGPTDRSTAGSAPSAQSPAVPMKAPAPSSGGRLSAAEAAQRLLAAGGKPTLAVTTRREPPPQGVGENSEGLGPLTESPRREGGGPLGSWPADPAPPSHSGSGESATGPSGEMGPAARVSANSGSQQRRATTVFPTAAINEADRGAPPPSNRSLDAMAASDRGARAAKIASTNPSSLPVSGPGGSSVSGGVAAWPGDPVDVGSVSGAGGVDAAGEVRRANIARVLEAGGGRPTVVVSGVPESGPVGASASAPGSAPVPAPAPAPAPQLPSSSLPVSGPGGSSVSGGVAAWPGDPIVDRGQAAGYGDGRHAQPMGGRAAAEGGQSEANVRGANRQSESVRRAAETTLRSREPRVTGDKPLLSPTGLNSAAEPPNGVPPRSAGAEPAGTLSGPLPRSGAEAASVATPETRPASEEDPRLGLRTETGIRSSSSAQPVERMTSAARSSGMLGHLEPSSGSARSSARPTVAESVASRSVRREQPGVLGQQALVVDRSGGSGSSLGLPAVDRGLAAGPMPSVVSPASDTESAEGRVVQAQRRPARPTVAESVASRSVRREQPGVLGQQALVVDRSGGSGSSLGLPAVDRGLAAGPMPSVVSPAPDTVSAESLVARLQGRSAQPIRAERETPPTRPSAPQLSTPSSQRSVSVPAIRGPSVTAPSNSSAPVGVSMTSETIRRSPAESGSDVSTSDESSNDLDIEALTDEIERRLQRRLRLGFDRRGGFRGGGRSWPR